MVKKILLVGALVLGLATSALAFKPVTFEWECNTEVELTGYTLYLGGLSGAYTSHHELGMVTPDTSGQCQFTLNSPPYHSFYALTAHGDLTGDESDYSDEVEHASKFSTPRGLRKKLN